jgi:hypothetical protein
MTDLLLPIHAAQLAASAIAKHVINARGYQSIAPGAVQPAFVLTGGAYSKTLLKEILHKGALAFPVYRLGAPTPYAWVLRPEMPRHRDDGKAIKYEWPRDTPNIFDVLPCYRDAINDPTIPIWITEGAKKADALASAYGPTIVPINENGVWGWRGRGAKGGKAALPDMELIAWEGRQVVIAPDGDVKNNDKVRLAVQRLARLLIARGVGELQICYLPQARGAAKLGIDDYLAAGHTPAELDSLLVPLDAVANGARVPFGTHPETKGELMLPAGYDVRNQTIYQVDEGRMPRKVYSGAIYVAETGTDMATGERSAVIRWNGRGTDHGELTIPYAALSDTKTFGNLAGGQGAALGPKNIKDVMQFLVEFTQENRETLPHRAHTDRLGLIRGGLVLPAGAIGFDEAVRYIGRPVVQVGADADAYPAAIRQLLNWANTWPAWLVVGLSLAAPAIARLKLRRNPVLYLSGPSGSSKTTIGQFATGCWGDPTRSPLRVESGRTTPAGIFQTLEHLGSLPALVDEAHTVPEPKRLELACYGFANGQTYTKGGADGKARGGETIGGVLLLAGEALPEFKHAGSRLRVLWADTGLYPPLGTEARSDEGKHRAAQLERAWAVGAGLLGREVAARIWADWGGFVADVRALQADVALVPLGPWAEPLAAAAAALNVVFRAVGVTSIHLPDPSTWVASLLDAWAAMLLSGQHETDPALDAWEGLITMLAQGRRGDDGYETAGSYVPAQWEYIEADRGGGVIACRKAGDSFWRVLTSTPQFKERVGPAAVQLYGQTWLKRGLVQPNKDNKSTEYKKVYPTGAVRVLKVTEDKLSNW